MNQTEVPIWLRYNIETGKFDRYPENLKLVVDYLPKPAGDCHFFEIYYERIQEYDILKTEDLSVFCEAIGLDFADESDVFDPKHDIWVRKEALLLNAGIKEITQDARLIFWICSRIRKTTTRCFYKDGQTAPDGKS